MNHSGKSTTKKHLRGFSLLETVVSLGIIGIIIVMLNTVIINMAIIAQKSLARSFVREEVTTIVDEISRDIRGADRVLSCSGSYAAGNVYCELGRFQTAIWTTCEVEGSDRVCKLDNAGNQLYVSSESMRLDAFTIEQGVSGTGNVAQQNVLVTIVAGHQNENLDVNNIVRQTTVSTRNYILQ